MNALQIGLLVVLCSAASCRDHPGSHAGATGSSAGAVAPDVLALRTEPEAAAAPKEPLTIAYSDWPGWIAWDIAVERGFFKQAGVDVTLKWFEYVPSMEAFSEGKVDSVCMTNGDALVSASGGAQGVGIILNDYSNGNDMIVARPGIKNVAGLRGKRIGVEIGFVDHLLLIQALNSAGMSEADVQIINEKTHKTPQLLKSGAVDAIGAWQPNSGQALEMVAGAKPIFTSANVPGLIYDLLYVNPRSLKERRAEWKKVVSVWFRVVSYIADPKTRPDAMRVMGARVQLSPEKFSRLSDGTFLLDLPGNQRSFARRESFDSVYGSTQAVDKFNVANHTYRDQSDVDASLDPTLIAEVAASLPASK